MNILLFIVNTCRHGKYFLSTIVLLLFISGAWAQTAREVLQKLKQKLEKVNDYEASGQMKTNVAFIKAPVADIKVYFKRPDKLRITNQTGISFIPKGSVNISLDNVFSDLNQFDIIDAGKDNEGLRIIKLLSESDSSDIVLCTVYVDEKSMLIKKSITTTKENGTYELAMSYGKYAAYGLPDKIVFSFNTNDYKLPKGITLDYDDGSEKKSEKMKNKNGTVEIDYTDYSINKGIDDKIFQH